MQPEIEKSNPLNCFKPLVAIACAFGLGWILHLLLDGGVEPLDLGARLLVLVFGTVGWAVGVVFRGGAIHCGGTRKPAATDKRRYYILSLVGLVLLIAGSVALAKKNWLVYFGSILVLIALLVGEVGWGKPLRFIALRWWKQGGPAKLKQEEDISVAKTTKHARISEMNVETPTTEVKEQASNITAAEETATPELSGDAPNGESSPHNVDGNRDSPGSTAKGGI